MIKCVTATCGGQTALNFTFWEEGRGGGEVGWNGDGKCLGIQITEGELK